MHFFSLTRISYTFRLVEAFHFNANAEALFCHYVQSTMKGMGKNANNFHLPDRKLIFIFFLQISLFIQLQIDGCDAI